MKTAVLIAAGQPSTNPRLSKAATLLVASGFQVTVLYAHWVAWADENDKKLFNQYPQIVFRRVGGHPIEDKIPYYITRLLHKGAKLLHRFFPSNIFLTGCSYHRAYPLLCRRAKKTKADLYVSHNLAALPAAVLAAEKNGSVSIADLEDLFRGQHPDGCKANVDSITIEQRFVPRASHCTTASPMMTAAYRNLFPSVPITTIHNVFSKKNLQHTICTNTNENQQPLKLFWFSQTVGKQRGLEEIIEAMGELATKNISLTILGDCSAEMHSFLLKLATQHGVDSKLIEIVEPKPLDGIFKLASQHDIGLALEMSNTENNQICLSNKIFTYLLSGLAIIASDTPAQAAFLNEYPRIGFLHHIGNNGSLAKLFYCLQKDSFLLHRCKRASFELAATRFNWEEEAKVYRSVIDSCVA